MNNKTHPKIKFLKNLHLQSKCCNSLLLLEKRSIVNTVFVLPSAFAEHLQRSVKIACNFYKCYSSLLLLELRSSLSVRSFNPAKNSVTISAKQIASSPRFAPTEEREASSVCFRKQQTTASLAKGRKEKKLLNSLLWPASLPKGLRLSLANQKENAIEKVKIKKILSDLKIFGKQILNLDSVFLRFRSKGTEQNKVSFEKAARQLQQQQAAVAFPLEMFGKGQRKSEKQMSNVFVVDDLSSNLPAAEQLVPKQPVNFSWHVAPSNDNSGNTVENVKNKEKLSVLSSVQSNSQRINWPGKAEKEQEVLSITYEEIGLFPRSFSRVFDRFIKQVFSDVENLVLQEYRFYRYLFLTTVKCLFILLLVPFLVNFFAKNYLVRPLAEYFWNTKQTEIFLNSYQQKRAFAELKEFEEKLYFESLILPKSVNLLSETNFIDTTSTKHIQKQLTASLSRQPVSEQPATKSPGAQPPAAPLPIEQQPVAQQPATKPEGLCWPAIKSERLYLPGTQAPAVSGETRLAVKQRFAGSQPGQTRKEEAMPMIEENHLPTFLSTLNHNQTKNQKDSHLQSKHYSSELLLDQTKKKDNSKLIKTNIEARLQEKTMELAMVYNAQSIEAITNFFADLISFLTLFYLILALEIQINITKSFLLEVFFGLDDSKKSLLILLITDLLVGYHSSNLWELFFEFLFNHYGFPESQTGIFLLVATLPVLLDVLFKYLIFRHLNRSSPATVATYRAMIE